MSVCFDRFAEGLPDYQEFEPEPVAECYACGQEFYPGDVAMEMPDGSYCCCNASCIAEWVGADRRVL